MLYIDGITEAMDAAADAFRGAAPRADDATVIAVRVPTAAAGGRDCS